MGCWLGKNAGGTLGEPLEEKFGKKEMFHVDWYPFLPEGGIPNDDLELQLIWLQQLRKKGPGLTAADLVEAWTDCVAYNFDEYGLCKENMQKDCCRLCVDGTTMHLKTAWEVRSVLNYGHV